MRLLVLAPTPYRKTKEGQFYYRQKAYLLCDDNQLAAKELLQAYFDRWQIEINHRDEKSILGVGQAQVWADLRAPRVPALMVATYSIPVRSTLIEQVRVRLAELWSYLTANQTRLINYGSSFGNILKFAFELKNMVRHIFFWPKAKRGKANHEKRPQEQERGTRSRI